ncbi:hypothetical protein NQZ79_g4415 [Umbelopsis isabellina]|nr:hypothetical protein NQZ79_g4415 [Umbelopsis isabellina]
MTVKHKGVIFGAADPEEKSSWISPNDIAHLAVNVMTEPVEFHHEMVYDMTSVRINGSDRAAALSNVLGKEIKYIQVPFQEAYKNFMEHAQMPHRMAYAVVDGSAGMPFPVSRGLSTVLHREPETLQQWLTLNKDSFA